MVVAGRGEGRGSWFNTDTRKERDDGKDRWGGKDERETDRVRNKREQYSTHGCRKIEREEGRQGKRPNMQSHLQIYICSDRIFQHDILHWKRR